MLVVDCAACSAPGGDAGVRALRIASAEASAEGVHSLARGRSFAEGLVALGRCAVLGVVVVGRGFAMAEGWRGEGS